MCIKPCILISSDLIKKVKQHDRVAQKQLYHAYVKLVSSIAVRYVQNTATAQDVVQNTFIRVFTNIEKYDAQKGEIKAWLSKIAVNESIAILRSQKKVFFEQLEPNSNIYEATMTDHIFASMELEEVTNVIESLDRADKIILDLYFFEEYTHNEISEILNINIQSSRVKLHRAKKSFILKWRKINGNEIRKII